MWVIISRTKTERLPLSSIRWKILLAFLLIIGVSFAVMASRLTGFVSEYLYEQRIRQDSVSVERLAVTAAPLFQSASGDALNELLTSSSGEMGGRLMVLDAGGKVQFDSYGRLPGVRLKLPEVIDILVSGQTTSYGIHRLNGSEGMEETESYVAYCAASLTGPGGLVGVLLYASPVAEMMESLNQVEGQLTVIFVLVACAALAAAMIFSRLLTNPIVALTRTIRKMGKGDLSVRAPVRGSGELRNLAVSYNAMAEQLETIDASRNQFVSNASHELKTPLTTMKILLENVIYQPEMPADLRGEFLQDMNHEIDRLTSIVTDLLTLTKMDSHKMELHLTSVDLSSLTAETLRLLEPTAQQRHQLLTGRVAPGIQLTADESKLGQVIYNLTENAIKYTPDGGQVTVSLNVRGRNALLRVEDNGVGIPKEDQAHIFDRFYRVDKARSRETGGTGLGLSIVKQLVTLHGGDIRVESAPGRGSTFTVELPLDAGKKEEQA